MTIDWHNQDQASPSLPQSFSAPVGYLAPAKIQLSLMDNQNDSDNLVKLSKLAETIVNDPLAMVEFTEKVYHLMEQDLQHQSDRLGYQQDLM